MSSGAQDFETTACIPSGPLDLEVQSGGRAFYTLRVENLYREDRDGGCGEEVSALGHQDWKWKQRLMQKG